MGRRPETGIRLWGVNDVERMAMAQMDQARNLVGLERMWVMVRLSEQTSTGWDVLDQHSSFGERTGHPR